MNLIKKLMMFLGIVGISLTLANAQEIQIGSDTPDFTLNDVNGQTQHLADHRGKFVVLEWFNYDCPFIKKHYSTGNMQSLQKSYTEKGVIWFSINSSAPGKQGNYPPDQMKKMSEERSAASTAVLLDPEGLIGRLYGAKTTPHLFIINPEGKLIYRGAIDDQPSTDPEDVKEAVNYVQKALDEAMSGNQVATPETDSYGCSVKY